MLKIKALNQRFSFDEDRSTIKKEAQEEITLDMYNKSLRLQSCGDLLAAEDILQTIIEDNIPQLESQGGLPKTMSTLKYSCYVNLGSIAMKRQNLDVALENYLIASELDKTDVTLWYKIGTIALKLDRFKLASTAFAKGLECSDSHWPCLDQLISVLFALRDTVACLIYIGKALILDSNYMKGLVLRKNIYDCNPATKDYYQLYNPDYIYEPSLDITIDKNDEIKYLEEAQKLCDRVNEVEKSLGAKPLPRIPLPKPLEEFTWLSIGLTLTELHKYVSDNNMSHFSFVDLKKCMSLNGETFDTAILEGIEKNNNIEECKYNDAERRDDGGEYANENLIKDESDKTPERRLSQASDVNTNCNATDVENSTPIQTDNDEMEQDIDDIDENMEQRTEKKTPNRGTKRRRDLVSDLQIWGWHNKRRYAKKAKVEKDFTIEDALKRIIPNRLLPKGIDESRYTSPDDSNTAMDVVTAKNEEEHNTFVYEQQIENPYFGSEQEKEDAQKWWFQTWVCCDVVNLIESYVYHISKLWKHKWPSQLISVYIEAYNMFREHVEHPKFCNNTNFEEFRNDALATLLYGELCTFNQIHDNKIHHTSLSFLQLISAWEDSWGEEHATFWCRVHWLRTHIFRKDNQNLLAITALQLIQEVFASSETVTKLSLLNCKKYGTISESVVNRLLNNLEMMESLSQLEKLYDSQKYSEVANILKLTFSMSNPPIHGRMGRPAQLGMLLHSLWYTDIIDCFIWTEECLNESLKNFLSPQTNSDKWEMVVIKCLMFLNDIIKTETVTILDYLSPENRSRLIESLTKICCHQVNSGIRDRIPLGTVLPWIILHYVLVREEHRQQAKIIVKRIKKDDDKLNKPLENDQNPVERSEEDLPPSIAVLFSGHDFLGPKGFCLTNQGELLHFILDTIIDRLDTPIFESLREKIDIHLEQAFFCLYQHPSKKNKVSRHLADHSVNPLPLTWERAQQICEFFCPNALPEFDSYKSISISGELEQLLQRISSLVPPECDPQPLVPKIAEFVDGASNTLPEPINFPTKTRSMYYLLGDYHFKQNEIIRSTKYFLLDLCINPLRLDTWACMALGIASQLEQKLNHCEVFNTTEFLDKARGAQICYKQALSLANDHTTLWVEYGSFEYMVHAFCSRVSKSESDTLSMERFAAIETKKEELLNSCKNSFLRALELQQSDQIEIDERWLFHYVLGKIAEKHQKEPSEYLQHYLTAAALLNENKATYPDKITYVNPPHLSIEALEIHYRINASILKYLELHEGKPIPDGVGKMFKQCLETSIFPKQEEAQKIPSEETENKTATLDNEAPVKETAEAIEKEIEPDATNDEVKKCVEDMLVQVESDAKEEEDVIKKESQSDVIMIEDSDEDNTIMKETKIEPEERCNIDVHTDNIQDIMDAMMKETMDKTEETPMDTDSDITLQEVVISPENTVIKVEEGDVKVEVKEESSGEDVKSERMSDESIRKSVEETTSTSSSSSDSDSSDSDSDDSSSSTTSTTSSDNNGNLNDNEVLSLVDHCIAGLEECIRRLPQNYKALYRLAHLYFHYNKKKDLIKCKQLLLGEYKCKNGVIIAGLFSEHKLNNFFNNIWRIPSSEIDRPGSLAAHMGRCVSLLLHVLHDTNDHKTLLDLCLQLKRVPDADKTYIRHSEREQLSDQALTLCIQSLRKQIKNMDSMSSFAKQKMLLDIYRIYQKSQKNLPFKESVFSGMLVDVFKKFNNEMAPENTNTLDLAVKYCQQNRAEKLKKQNQNLMPRSASTSSANVPVLPTPSIISPPPTQPLKRPGLGRPRGRPPGPKIPGQVKSSRGRSPSSNPLWNKPTYESTPYDYLKHYQKELLRQYHQTLTLTQQMSQLGSFLPPTSQNNLLNSVSFLQAMQQLSTGVNPLLLNQLMQNINHNPGMMKNANQMNTTNVMKNISEMYKMPANIPITSSVSQAMNSDHMRHLSNLAQSMNLPNLMNPSPVVSTQPKTTFGIAKTSTNVSKLSSVSNIPKNINTTFKYPAEIAKPKMKDVTKTTSSYVPKDSTIMLPIKSNTIAKETDKATSILKDRPNISITPVAQTITNVISPPKTVTATPPKTLQEKLADKQKQHKNIDKMSYMSSSPSKQFDKVPVMSMSSNKALDFMSKVDKPVYTSSSTSSFKTSSLSNLNIPSSLNVFASFPKDSSYNINQAKPSETSLPSSRGEHPLSKMKISQSLDLPANLPMSLSVIRKPEDIRERNKSSDDDVIIIE